MATQTPGNNNTRGTSNRGFASMDPEMQRKIAQKGGEAVSRDREHMSMIGRKGGEASGGGNRNRGGTEQENR
jgi:general stress protein YciG